MKKRKIFALITCILALFLACSCEEGISHSGKVKVVFNLEGGIYQNTERAIIHYYALGESGESYICDPETLTGEKIERGGYHIEGWYVTKEGEGDTAQYFDQWDFSQDKISESGVILYAKWLPNITFTYQVCYLNDSGEKIVLGSYPVKEGETFSDYANYAKKRTDGIYTPVGFTDSEGNVWDQTFAHPGGEQSLAIDVYVNYLKGDFEIVSTARQLKSATKKNIYLTADIDLNGEEIDFGDYKYQFIGNGHTISNFKIRYDAGKDGVKPDLDDDSKKSLFISLFGDAKDATIENVNFANVLLDINTFYSLTYKIYVAPIAMSATNCSVKNVGFEGTYKITRLPDGLTEETSVVVCEEAIKTITESTVENLTVSFTKTSN